MSPRLPIAQLGHPILRASASVIENARDPAVQSLIDDMLATLSEIKGIGLAAPQVYQPQRLFVVAIRPTARFPNAPLMEPTAILNPEIMWSSQETSKNWEACWSIPGIRGMVPRPRAIRLRYMLRSGETAEQEFTGFTSWLFQHEFDHLDGHVYLDRLESVQDIMTEAEYQRQMPGQ
jgi:peptide deformylase